MGWAAKVLRFIWQNKGWIIPVVAEAYNVVSKWIRDKKDSDPGADSYSGADSDSGADADSDKNNEHNDNTT